MKRKEKKRKKNRISSKNEMKLKTQLEYPIRTLRIGSIFQMPMSHRHNRYARKNSPDSGTFSIDYLAFRELAQSIHGEQCVCVFLCRSEGYYWPQINCDLYVFDFWQYIRTQRTNFGWFLWHLWNGSSSLVCQKFICFEILLRFFCVAFFSLFFLFIRWMRYVEE